MRSIKDINKKNRELFRENSIFYRDIENIISRNLYEPVDNTINQIDVYLRQTHSVMDYYITNNDNIINVLIKPLNSHQIISVDIVINSNNTFF